MSHGAGGSDARAGGSDALAAGPVSRRPLAPLAENVGESFTACMVAMVQGNLLAVTVGHVVIASQTGLASGLLATLLVWLTRARSRWAVSLVLGGVTVVVDAVVHPGMFGPVFAEAAVTGAVAGGLSYAVGAAIGRVRRRRGPPRHGSAPEMP